MGCSGAWGSQPMIGRLMAVLVGSAILAGAFEVGGITSDTPAALRTALYVFLTCILGAVFWNPWVCRERSPESGGALRDLKR